MPVASGPLQSAWMRARSQCECQRARHAHPGRCRHPLLWVHRGHPSKLGGWQALHTGSDPLDRPDAGKTCEILCWECYCRVRAETLPDQRTA